MRAIEGSSRGRGGSGYRGRGGRGGRGGGRGGSDKRFASRFTDPRFQLSKRLKQGPKRHGQPPRDAMQDAAAHDPRFRKFLKKPQDNGYQRDSEDDRTDEEDEDNASESTASSSHSGLDEEVESLEESVAQALDEEVNAWAAENVEMIEARRRVAIVNCDWDHIRAVDLYAILFHALPLGGQLKDVCIYQSEFGKKMIAHERAHGPDLWSTREEIEREAAEAARQKAAEPVVEELPDEEPFSEDEDDDEDATRSDGWHEDNPAMMEEEGENGEMFSSGKYRRYEMDRMRYYYAVATFDSAETAAAVYEQLDGMDIEASGVVLDLRYVDDEETFDSPVSRADRIPPNFRPLASFKAAALTQTKFRISWDQDDVFRHQSVQDAFTGETAEDDLAAYMAPPDSDDDEVDTRTGRTKAEAKMRVRRKYAALLEDIGGLVDDIGEDDEGLTRERASASVSASEGESESDDDALNRFSDVELDSNDDQDDDGDGDDADDDDRASNMSMEATLDMDADAKAAGLQREARLRQRMKTGDLAANAELKYRLRRKDMKKAKKEMMKQQREEERLAAQRNRESDKAKLRALMGEEDEDGSALTGKARRKAHARKVKERLAAEREDQKKRRAAGQFGVTQELRRIEHEREAEKAVAAIDTRFQAKLLSDPRFQLDVSQKDKRIASDVADLANQVAKARVGNKKKLSATSASASTEETTHRTAGKKRSADESASGGSAEDAVDFFLTKPSTKKPRRV